MTVQPPAERPAPGYYPDPSIPGFVRYWDGDGWTPGSARPAPADGAPLPPPPRAARGGLRVAPPPPPRPTVESVEETGPVFLDETGAAHLVLPDGPDRPDGQPGVPYGAAAPEPFGSLGSSAYAQPAEYGRAPGGGRGAVAEAGFVPSPFGQSGLDEGAPYGGAPYGGATRGGTKDALPHAAPFAPPAPATGGGGQGAASVGTPAAVPYGSAPGLASAAAPTWGATSDAQPGLLDSGEVPSRVTWGVPGEVPAPAVAPVPAPAPAAVVEVDADEELASALRLALSQTRRAQLPPPSQYESQSWDGIDPTPAASALRSAERVRPDQRGWTDASEVDAAPAPTRIEPAAPAGAPTPQARSAAPVPRTAEPTAPRDADRADADDHDQALALYAAQQAARAASAPPSTVPPAGLPPKAAPNAPAAPAVPSAHPTVAAEPMPEAQPPKKVEPPKAAQPSKAAPPSKRPVGRPRKGPRPALLGPRIGARIVDTVVEYAVVGVLGVVLAQRVTLHLQAKVDAARASGVPQTVWLVDGTVLANAGLLLAALLAVGVVYETIPLAVWGRSLGKAMFGLTVLDARSKARPNLVRTAFRTALCQTLVFLLVGILELVPCATDRKLRQSWHDKLGRTFVAKQ